MSHASDAGVVQGSGTYEPPQLAQDAPPPQQQHVEMQVVGGSGSDSGGVVGIRATEQ